MAFGVTVIIRPLAEQTPFALLFAAVMVSAWYGGLGPGLLASALATLASAASILPSAGAVQLGGGGLVPLTVFVAVSLLIASLTTAREEAARLRLSEQAAGQLRESEARFRSVFEHTQIGMALQAPDGQYVRVNQGFCDLLGFAEAELLAAAPASLSHPDERDADAAAVRELLADVRPVDQREKRYLHRLGHVVWALVSVSVIRDPEGRPRYLSVQAQDITAWKELQSQLRQAQKMEAVGQLAGGVAHDFNNLLTVIRGRSSLLQHHLAVDDPLRRHIDLIETAAAQGARLTGQLLAFSRKQTLQSSTLDLNDSLAQMHDMLRRLIGEEVELVVAPGPGLGYVRADPSQIEQVILNLAVNARDAMPDGGRLLLETANVALDEAFVRSHPGARPGAYVQLAVTDTGVGMDAEIRSHLFEPFFTTKERGKGTGLGLATVYGIVKQSGGYVAVQSQPGRGSTFTVCLPRSEAPLAAPLVGTTAPGRGAETVLLVEDEASVRDLVSEMLEATGYTVLQARHGGEALVVADQHTGPLHLLLSDVVMPHMGGRELARRLRRTRPTLKVLYMSGYLGDATPPEGLEQGVPLLAKPFTAEALAHKLREVLDAPPGDGSRVPGS